MVDVSAYLNVNFDDESFPDRVDRAAAAGVDGFEFLGWDRELSEIAARRDEHDLELVYMSGARPDLTDPSRADAAVESIERSIDLATEMDCANLNVKAGPDQEELDRTTQREAVVEVLRRAAPAAEAAGVTLVLEPLNPIDAPGHFLCSSHEGYEIVDAVDSPNVGLLFDVYHHQITAGDVVRSLREYADRIGHVHIADVPTQAEPGTGELNFENVIAAIHDVDYDGYVGCEFIPSGDPEAALRDVVELVRSDP